VPDQTPSERNVPGLTPPLRRRLQRLFRLLTLLSPALAAGIAAHWFLRPRARRISAEDAAFLATARRRRLLLPSGAVQVYEWPGEGPAVLLLHGWTSHAARLGDLIRALQTRDLRVVALDAPAHGSSAGQQADLHKFREALVAVSDACAPIGAVAAHSFGALAAIGWLASAAPASVAAAVLVGTMRDAGYVFESFTRALRLRGDVVRRMRALFHARYGAYPESFSALESARHVHVPVLLVHGEADQSVPAAHSAEIFERLPQAQLLLVPGLAHSAPLHDPASLHTIMQFIESHLWGQVSRL